MARKGKFVVIDGLDGIGKGTFLRLLVNEAQKKERRVFDLENFWKNHNYHPKIAEVAGEKDVVVTCEPTFTGIGRYIREEMIAKNNRRYSPETLAEAYALDRRILYEHVVLPALEIGADVCQSRSFSTSLIYQRQSASDLGREFNPEEILAIPGNKFCHQNPMDFLIVLTIFDVQEAMRRSSEREKDDNCIFENLPFQLKIKEHFESQEFRILFEKMGTTVVYIDAGKTIEHLRQEAVNFYHGHLNGENV